MIVISIQGGVLVDVFSDNPDQECILIDWDVEGCDPECEADFLVFEGDDPEAYAVQFNLSPIEAIVGTDASDVVQKMKTRDLEAE